MHPFRCVSALRSAVLGEPSASQEERNARSLMLSGAWLGFVDGGIITYLPVFLARLGATPTILGLLAAGPQLITMLTLIPGGAIVERQKDHVRLANKAAIVARSGYLLIALLPFFLAPSQIPLVAVVVWSAISLTTAVHLPALLSVITKAVSPQQRPRVNAGRWATWTVVGALVIPIMGVMLDHLPSPTGYQLVFLLSFLGALPNLYFFGRVRIPDFAPAQAPGQDHLPLGTRLRAFVGPFFESKRFVRYNVATGFFRLFMAMPAGLYAIYWVDYLRATDSWIGLRGFVAYMVLTIFYYICVKITYRVGHRTLLLIAGLMMGLYPIATGLAPSVEWLLLAAAFWGFGIAGIDIGLVDMLLAACPEGRQPSFAAAANTLASMEAFIGPLLGAVLAEIIGVQYALLASGALVIASCSLFMLLPSHEQEKAEHSALLAVASEG